jgi:hypothetical protein
MQTTLAQRPERFQQMLLTDRRVTLSAGALVFGTQEGLPRNTVFSGAFWDLGGESPRRPARSYNVGTAAFRSVQRYLFWARGSSET